MEESRPPPDYVKLADRFINMAYMTYPGPPDQQLHSLEYRVREAYRKTGPHNEVCRYANGLPKTLFGLPVVITDRLSDDNWHVDPEGQ